MAAGKFVSYLRVSTKRQGDSGLGLEAQRMAVSDFLNGGQWELIGERVEVESGKSDANRPELERALKLCRLHGATLVIAKLDRLSRDAHFLLGLQKAGVRFVAADMPEANEMIVGIMAVVAQAERKMISARTKAALAQKRAFYAQLTPEDRARLLADGKAVQLGGDRGAVLTDTIRAKGVSVRQERSKARANDLAADISEIRASGAVSLREIAAGLNARGIPTARGGTWSAVQVKRVLQQAA
ncbi:recombinase family protein [Methylobacterium longum]|uniref:Recombinase family protein n=1 Tax=Methylobacterium longum TaxID=767694 RepID=A0ABT8B009_9HYPH|nr:recombinase family protein [Methylobacterium longum]MDN3575011.1 recombinase family protein [Methylobacterium longum]